MGRSDLLLGSCKHCHYCIFRMGFIMKRITTYQVIIFSVFFILLSSITNATDILSGRKHAEIRMLMSDDALDLKMAAKSLQRKSEQDPELTDMLADKLWQRCSTIDTDKDDTAAWMGKGVAASKQTKYLKVIELCLQKLTHPNTTKHLNLAKNQLTEGNANTFTPGQIAWDKYRALIKQGPKQPAKNVLKQRFTNLKYGLPLEQVYQELGIPDGVGGSNVSKGRAGHLFLRFSRSGNMLAFKYNGLGAVHFYSEKGDNTWIVHKATSDTGLYWYDKTKSFIDIKKVMAEARGSELRTLMREFAFKLKRRIPIEDYVYPLMADRLSTSLDEKDEDTLDALSDMCKLLGYSKDAQYHSVLTNAAQNAADSTLKEYAEKYINKLEDDMKKKEQKGS